MTCLRLKSECVPDGFVCGFHPIYEYDGFLFEVHGYGGPIPLRRKDHEPRRNIPTGFWFMWKKFCRLSDEEKMKYLFKGA